MWDERDIQTTFTRTKTSKCAINILYELFHEFHFSLALFNLQHPFLPCLAACLPPQYSILSCYFRSIMDGGNSPTTNQQQQ